MDGRQPTEPISFLRHVKDITSGSYHSIAITDSGFWVWGKLNDNHNSNPQQNETISDPYFVEIKVQKASAGSEHSFVWRQNQVYCWGSNKDYKLGLEQPKDYKLTKSQIFQQAFDTGMKLCEITCGDSHSLAVFKLHQENETSYQIFAWGQSKNYQLALEAEGAVTEPILIDFNEPVKKVYSRSEYNFLVTLNGDCFSWGNNLFGRLGFGVRNSTKNQKIPCRIKELNKISSVSMGKYHCIAVNELGQIYSWGHGMHGQLGLNQIVSQTSPTKIQGIGKVIQSSCGEYHSLILSTKGEIFSCGSNSYSALGHDKVDSKKRCKIFTMIPNSQKHRAIKIVSGNRHNLLLKQDGTVMGWGCNKYGQLGYSEKQQTLNIRKQLYRQIQTEKSSRRSEIYKKNIPISPFLEVHETSPPGLAQSKLSQKFGANGLTVQQKIEDWNCRYEKFRAEKQTQEKQFMRELQQILKFKHN